MKSALQKSPIPENHAFVVSHLKERYFDPNWHFHAEYQIFMVLKGAGTRFIGDHVTPFKPGDITFTGPNLPHLWRSDELTNFGIGEEHCEGIVVYFNENLIGKSFLQTEEALRLRQLFKKSLRGLDVTGRTRETVHQMIAGLPELNGFTGVLELLNILNMLSNTNDLEPLASPGYTNSLKEGDTERMNKVYAYVMQNFRGKITVSELAELTSMTPTSFSRYFKVHANKTFSEFVSEIRIGHACKLLIEKRINASQACYASGFQTLSNFNKQFKTITKRTPMAYKKEYRPV
ncbi:AraC family transcriptional regulator [Eudoraea chungangensis]|uniref:AraC family transcriptional regulator n=1 Tax=Eudoraea chungangensis TaxID=1481905 RepID=UPI0023ECFBA2|nr:AraC family transcriptional regulator [Eudoraea chungangensis]